MSLTERENLLLCLSGKEPEWLPNYSKAVKFAFVPALDRKKDPVTGHLVDVFGVEFEQTPDGATPAGGRTGKYTLEDITDWREVMPKLDLDSIDWEEQCRLALGGASREEQLIVYAGGFIWEQLHYLMGFENALIALLTEPEAVNECLHAITDFWISAAQHVYKYLKPDNILLFDHIATQTGTMMSPEVYRRLIKPHQKRFFDAVRELGARTELHCDGKIESVLADYAEIGVQVLQPFQIFNDINAAKEKYGFFAVGGWDYLGEANTENATEEVVRASVRKAMDDYGPSLNYAFWASGVNPRCTQIIKWIDDEAETYGRAFYKK